MAIFKAAAKPPKTKGGLRNLLHYVLQEEKTEERLVDGTGDFHDFEYGYHYDPDRVLREYERVQEEYGKKGGRLAAHYILSFPPGEVSAAQAHELGLALAEKLWPDHQVLVVTHIDKEHLHDHFIINSVAYADGHKLHTTKQDLKVMKKACDELCEKNGLSVVRKGHHADGMPLEEGEISTGNRNLWKLLETGKKSYLAECAACVRREIQRAISREDFIARMESCGWKVNWKDSRKHITFEDPEGHRVRDSKISSVFYLEVSKEGLIHEFERNAAVSAAGDRSRFAETAGGAGKDDIEAAYDNRRGREEALDAARREREAAEAERERRKGTSRHR